MVRVQGSAFGSKTSLWDRNYFSFPCSSLIEVNVAAIDLRGLLLCILISLFLPQCFSQQTDTTAKEIHALESDFEDAAKRVLLNSTGFREKAELIQTLRSGLYLQSTQRKVLRVLSKYPVVQLDPDLALLLTSEPRTEDLPDILNAIVSSGGLSSEGAMLTMATDLTVLPPVAGNSLPRLLVWKAWTRVNPIPALDAALHYYLDSEPGGQDLEQNAAIADFLCATLSDASKIPTDFTLASGNITKLLGKYGAKPNTIGKSDIKGQSKTNQRRVLAALFEFSTKFHDIATLDRQIDFIDSKDAMQKALVEKIDFTPWQNYAAWLAIPRTSNSDLPTEASPEQIVEHYRTLTKILGRSAEWQPIALRVIDEDTANWLAQYSKLVEEDKGMPAPPPVPIKSALNLSEAVEMEIKWANFILSNISQDYGLQNLPSADSSIIAVAARGTWETFATVNRTAYFAEDSLRRHIEDVTGWPRNKAKDLADALVMAEVERQALSTYALYRAMWSEGKAEAVSDITKIDGKLDDFESRQTGNGIIRTELVAHISGPDEPLQDFRDCAGLTLSLVSRELSLMQMMYREKVLANCEGDKQFKFDWIGRIPLPFQLVLQRHPRIFDFLGASFAIREILRQRPIRQSSVDAVDLVRAEPRKTIPTILAAMLIQTPPSELLSKLYSPHQQSTAVKQFILGTRVTDRQPPLPTGPITEPEWSSDTNEFTKERFRLGYPGGIGAFHGLVIVKPDDYIARTSNITSNINKMLGEYAQRRALQQFRDWYDQNVSDKNDCNWLDVLCDVGLLKSDNETKKLGLKNIGDTLRKLDANSPYWRAWDLTPLSGGRATNAEIRELIIKSDGSGFFELFEFTAPNGEIRYAPIESTEHMPPWLVSLIQREGKDSPTLFGLDPGLDFDGEADRFTVAWLLSLQTRILAERNLTPIIALEDIGESSYGAHSIDESLFVPVLGSQSGRLLALEQTLWNAGLESSRVSTLLPKRGGLKSQLAQVVWSNWQAIVSQVNAAASAKAAENEDRFKSDMPYTFGITVGFGQGSVVIGPILSLGNSGISVATDFSGGWVVAGKIDNQSIPAISFVTSTPAQRQAAGAWESKAGYSTRIELTSVEESAGEARFSTRAGAIGPKPPGGAEPWQSIFPGLFVGPLKNAPEIESGDLRSLGYIIARARPKLTDAQLKDIHKSAPAATQTPPLLATSNSPT